MSTPVDLSSFLATAKPANLGPDPRPGVQTQAGLEEQLKPLLEASGLPIERRQLVRALVLLWHDHLNAAHVIAQDHEGPDGAFVHGIMHRREPDFGNAAYWFRRVGRHPAFAEIGSQAAILLRSTSHRDLVAKLPSNGEWDPFAFIDACARASSNSARSQSELRELQRIEFSALLSHLLR